MMLHLHLHLCLQMFISGKPGQAGDELERQLFIVRKLIERAKTAAMGAAAEDFYACSLSNRTIVYKVRQHSCKLCGSTALLARG